MSKTPLQKKNENLGKAKKKRKKEEDSTVVESKKSEEDADEAKIKK